MLFSSLHLLFSSLLCMANDGFYQGAGATVLPVQNNKLQVLSEDLQITSLQPSQCYKLLLNGKTINSGSEPKKGEILTFGAPQNCQGKKIDDEMFEAKFHAKAIYHVRAIDNVEDVQMGFPVPQWKHEWPGDDGLNSARVPGVINFKTFINGQEIKKLQAKEIQLKKDLWGNPPKKGDNANLPALIWNASFKKNTDYELLTEYDFGFDISNGFYPPRVPEKRPLWWDKRTLPEGYECPGCAGGSLSIIYFLHPLKLWSPPAPKEIKVRVATPPSVPVTYLVTATKGLDCIDKGALYFRWQNKLPESDLFVSYPPLGVTDMPQQFSEYRPIKTDDEFLAWIKLLAESSVDEKLQNFTGKLKLACDLVDDLKKNLKESSLLYTWTKNGVLKCVQSCGPN